MSQSQALATVESAPVADVEFQRRMRRLATEAAALTREHLLPYALTHKGRTARPFDEVKADVMAICLTADSLGIRPSINIFSQFHVIQGTVVPSTQVLTGLAWRAGCEVWLDDESDDTKATAHLTRLGSRREHVVTYTVEQAAASGALDFWYEGWQGQGDNSQKMKEVVGQDLETAKQAPVPTWAKGGLKSNPAWHAFRADMLAWRAFRRVLKRGAPDISAGLIGLGDMPIMGIVEGPGGPMPVVDRDPDTGQAVEDDEITDAEIVEQAAPNVEAGEDSGPTGPSPQAFAASERTVDQGGGEPVVSADGAPSPTRPSPLAKAIHIAAHDAGVSETVLDKIIESVTGDVSANSITMANKDQVLTLIWEASETSPETSDEFFGPEPR